MDNQSLENINIGPSSLDKLSYIYRFLPFGFCRINRNGVFVYWGENIMKLLKYSTVEIINKIELSDLFIQPNIAKDLIEEVFSTGEAACKIFLKNKSGAKVYVHLGLFLEEKDNPNSNIAVLVFELSSEATLEKQLENKDQSLKVTFEELLSSYKYIGSVNRHLAMLISTISEATNAKSLQHALDAIAQFLQRVTNADASFIRLADENLENLTLKAYKGPSSNRPKRNLKVVDSLFYRLKLRSELIIIPDMSKQEEYRSRGLAQNKFYKSLLLYPLCVDNRLRGMLVSYSEESNKFDHVDQHIMSILAGLTTLIVRFFSNIKTPE